MTPPAGGALLHTPSGRVVDLLRPTPGVVAIGDIAHSLARQTRYLGYTRQPYSVAQHAVAVSRLCEPADALAGLLHDAAEAYLGDVSMPLKRLPLFSGYRALEAAWLAVILQAFGLPGTLPASVLAIDARLRLNEGRDLFTPVPAWAESGTPLALKGAPIQAMAFDVAESYFLQRFDVCQAQRRPASA